MKSFLSSTVVLIVFAVPFVVSAGTTIIPKPSNNLGLVGHWTMDGADVTDKVYDKSGNSNNGYYWGGSTTSAKTLGKLGQALKFNGTSNTVYVGDVNAMDGLTRVTVSAWVKSPSSGANGAAEAHIADKSDCGGGAGDGPFELVQFPGDNKAAFVVYDAGGNASSGIGTTNIDDGRWHFVLGTYDGTDISIWVDGVRENFLNQPGLTLANTSRPFNIGGYCAGTYASWKGSIDDVRTYTRALSATEVRALYGSGASHVGASSATLSGTGLSNGLVGHWTFDGADVTDKVYDRSGQANHGYLRGGATSSAKALGKLGQSIKFNGTNQSIDVGSAASLDDIDTITISAWIKPDTSFTGAREIYAKVNDGSNFTDGPDLWYDPSVSNRLWFAQGFTGGGGYGAWYVNNSPLVLGQWQHVAVVYSRASASNNPVMYINGVLQTTTADVSQPAIGTARSDAGADAVIGGYGTINVAGFFMGSIDDVRVYNRLLSASEIKQLYNLGSQKINSSSASTTGASSLTTGLFGHWTFDGPDITANSILDKSGNGNRGGFMGGSTSSAKTIGKLGQALKFDGVGNYVDIGRPSFPGALTVSAWIKLRADFATECSSGCDIVSNYSATGGDAQFEFCFGSDGNLCYGYISNGGLDDIGSDGTTNNPITVANRWYHVVMTRNSTGSTIKMYVDGVAQTMANNPGHVLPSTTNYGRTTIGRDGDIENDIFNVPGVIDDVWIWNRELSASEVKQLYNLGR